MTAGRELIPAIMALDDERDELARRAEALAYAGQVLRRLASSSGSPARQTASQPRRLAGPGSEKGAVTGSQKKQAPPAAEGRRAQAAASKGHTTSAAGLDLRERVLRALREMGEASPKTIAGRVAAKDRAVLWALKRLTAMGQVVGAGVRRSRVYRLAAAPPGSSPAQDKDQDELNQDDANTGAAAPAENTAGRARIEIARARTAADWLQSRGYQVEALEGGRWRADRKTLDTAAMIALANRRRADLNMAPYVLRGVA